MDSYYQNAIQQHQLPPDFPQTIERWYQPLASHIATVSRAAEVPPIIGINGTQGSGKSTLADFLRLILGHEHNLHAAVLSIDDFYLTREERRELASNIHPLLETRGVPGTHDVSLAITTLENLCRQSKGQQMKLPLFDKALDDRAAQDRWPVVKGQVDVVIFEGWCVAATPQSKETLQEPQNELEAREDPAGTWRQYVNMKLAEEYQTLFAMLDHLIFLQAPSFECVYEWRLLQETKLAERWNQENPNSQARILNPDDVRRFISHYERLTRHCLKTLPDCSDWVLPLGSNHKITALHSPMAWDNSV